MKSSFEMTVIARDATLYHGLAQICTIMGASGSRSFEARHETFLTVLAVPSVVEIRTESGQEIRIPVASGLVSFAQNVCQLVVEADRPAQGATHSS